MRIKKYFTKEELLASRRLKYHENRHKLLPVYRERYWKNKEEILKKQKEKYHNDPEWKAKHALREKQYRSTSEFKAKRNTKEKIIREVYKNKLYEILGGYVCKKCGYNKDKRGLQIDHIKGGGTELRKKGDTSLTFKKYINNPDQAKKELQILCGTCNQIKRYENDEF